MAPSRHHPQPPRELGQSLGLYASWAAGAVYLFIGLFLLINPDLAAVLLLVALALVAFVAGVLRIISYHRSKPPLHANDFRLAIGMALIVFSVCALIWPDVTRALTLVLTGIAVVSTGFVFLQVALDAHRVKVYRWWIYLCLSAVSLGIGVLLFILAENALVRGILLILEGLLVLAARVFRQQIDGGTRPPREKKEPVPAPAAQVPVPPPAAQEPVPAPAAQEPAPAPEAKPAPAPEEVHEAPSLSFWHKQSE